MRRHHHHHRRIIALRRLLIACSGILQTPVLLRSALHILPLLAPSATAAATASSASRPPRCLLRPCTLRPCIRSNSLPRSRRRMVIRHPETMRCSSSNSPSSSRSTVRHTSRWCGMPLAPTLLRLRQDVGAARHASGLVRRTEVDLPSRGSTLDPLRLQLQQPQP